MSEARLKAFRADGSSAQAPDDELKPIPLSPLNISGIVVKKRDLVEALRIYVPLIADSNGWWKVWQGGALVIDSGLKDTKAGAVVGFDKLRVGPNHSGSTPNAYDIYFDEVYIRDSDFS